MRNLHASSCLHALGFVAVVALTPLNAHETQVGPQVASEVVRASRIDLDVASLARGTDVVSIQLFGGRTVRARREHFEPNTGGFTWSGSIDGDPAGGATIAVRSNAVSGIVWIGRELYRVGGERDGALIVEEIDAGRFPSCTPPLQPQRSVLPALPTPTTGSSSSGSAALAAATPIVDVLVVYTPAARAGQGGTAAIEALIDTSVALTNQAYTSSGVLQRVRLVGTSELTGYTETGFFTVELGRLTLPSDGWLDSVNGLRDACGADVVAMIVDSNATCGVANQMQSTSSSFAPYAFAVISRVCAAANYTFAHELGHVMGLTHDRDNATRKCSRASLGAVFAQASGASSAPSMSYNGDLVAFTSDAVDIVTGDTNGLTDVFVRNRGAVSTSRASISNSGVQADAICRSPVMSGGRFVLFSSAATTLTSADTNGVEDVFIRDLQGGFILRIMPAAGGTQANGATYEPGLSGDERWVTFTSEAANLGASSAAPQVFRWDRLTGALVLASPSTSGPTGNARSGGATASDGTGLVAFWSDASDLVAGDTNGTRDVFVRNIAAGTTERISLSSSSTQLAGVCEPFTGISADGRYVLFAVASSDVVTGDTNGATDLFVRDRTLGTTLLVSANTSGAPGNGPSAQGSAAAILRDGTRVAFTSRAADLVAGDTNAAPDVFVRNLVAGTTERVSLTSAGEQLATGGGDGSPVSISGLGQVIAFTSRAPYEVGDTNGVSDVYAFDRNEPTPQGISTYSYGFRTLDQQWRTVMAYAPGVRLPYFSNPAVSYSGQALGIASPDQFAAENWRALNDTGPFVEAFRAPVYTAFCFGDGSGTACPCGNASASGARAGCVNSLGLAGTLEADGSASLAGDTVALRGGGMPNSSVLYYQGTARTNGGAGVVFGDGLRCAGGSVQRLGIRTNASNGSSFPSAGDPRLSQLAHVGAPGTFHYQAWYRNTAAFCSPAGFNLTNGLSVAWRP